MSKPNKRCISSLIWWNQKNEIIKTQSFTTAALIMLSSLLLHELSISKSLFLVFLSFFFPAWELWSNVWIWFTNCTGPPSAPGRREQGESSVCRNDYLRFLILKLKVHRAFAPRTTVHQDILREIPFSMGMQVNSQSTQDSLGRKWRHE